MEQRSEEWFKARLGKVTASRVADLMARTKTGYSASRANYMAELICERLTGQPAERFSNAAMQWGTDNEPHAKAAYAFMRDATVDDVGFVPHPSIADFGASPDGLIGADGLIEIKCPFSSAVHIETLLNGMPADHMAQVQGQMWITGRQWCDFVSYDPRMPEPLQLHVQRIPRVPAYVADLERQVTEFLFKVGDKVEALRRLAEGKK